MRVPLIASSNNTTISNKKQIVEVWQNGILKLVDIPIFPYFYSFNNHKFHNSNNKKVEKIIYSNMEKNIIYKHMFKHVNDIPKFKSEDIIENGIPFMDRILIDKPDFFYNYPNTEPLKMLYFDIEVDSVNSFPVPDRNAIIAIGLKGNGFGKIFMSKVYDDDSYILKKFINVIKNYDPDIIVGYNSNYFDFPYVLDRLKINEMDPKLLTRNNKNVKIYKKTGKNIVNLGGRISFDIYPQVLRDQTIFGIKNKKMKTVADWMEYENPITVDTTSMRKLVNTPELRKYLISDVKITEFLSNIYFPNMVTLAEMMGIPLNILINSTPNFLGRIIHGREFKKMGIVTDSNNQTRYPKHIKNKQGAYVDTYKPGLYKNGVWKVDFKSLYPNIIRTFNLSPETIKLIRYEELDMNKDILIDITNNSNIYCIKDERFGKNMIVSVSHEEGFLKKYITNILEERFRIKSELKKYDKNSSEWLSLHAQENALKVVANAITGYHGQAFAQFGCLTVYCCITGFSRYYITLLHSWLKDIGISNDTDGEYISEEVDLEELNNRINLHTLDKFNVKNNYLMLDMDIYDAGFFRKTKGKQYILKNGEKLEFHGASFKGSHVSKIFDIATEKYAKAIFSGKNLKSVTNELQDMSQYDINDFVKNIKVKSKKEYKSSNAIAMQIIRQAEELGIKPKAGDQFSYLKSITGYKIVTADNKLSDFNIDYTYYRKMIDSARKNFKENKKSKKLDEFM